jgi:hypothetical protein
VSATVYSHTLRFSSRRFRRIRRLRWKGAAIGYCVLAFAGAFGINWIYQVIRKPGEILAPFSDSFAKSPESTWQRYGAVFERHSTSIIAPEFLGALAQVESNGNPIARTYWRWRWSWQPFEIYRPASSALGMFQITDGTFAEARRYCIRNHSVVTNGPWHDFESCWFNSFYTRTMASHSIEMIAAYLHRMVVGTLAHRSAKVTLAQKQKLAAVIHLCGVRRGEAFAARGFRVTAGERCGSHGLSVYLRHIDLMTNRFGRLRAKS